MPSFSKPPSLDRARELIGLKQFDDAISEYTRCIEVDPSHSGGYIGRGVAYRQKGELEKALTDYAQAIEMDPTPAAYGNRGNIYGQLGKLEEALSDFNHAIAIKDQDPKWPAWATFKSRAECYFMTSRFDLALADYLEVIRLNPERDDAYHGAARIWATCPDTNLRNPRMAIRYVTKANELCTTLRKSWQMDYMETLLAAFIENKDFTAAINVSDSICKKVNPSEKSMRNIVSMRVFAYRQRALLAMEQGDYETAVLDLTQVLHHSSEDAEAQTMRELASSRLKS